MSSLSGLSLAALVRAGQIVLVFSTYSSLFIWHVSVCSGLALCLLSEIGLTLSCPESVSENLNFGGDWSVTFDSVECCLVYSG